MTEQFNPRSYWESRLGANISLRGTGHRAFNLAYNDRLYAAQRDCVEQLLDDHDVDLQGGSALDVGSGNGFFVRCWLERGASTVTGLDITVASVAYLQRQFPQNSFAVADVAAAHLPLDRRFDLVSCISVLYHVVDDEKFARALGNLGASVGPGGHLLVSDTFVPSILPTARHARFRTLDQYRTLLARAGFEILDVLPVYYLLNRTFVPLVGPAVLNRLNLAGSLYRLDSRWRAEGRSNGDGMKLLLARKRDTPGSA